MSIVGLYCNDHVCLLDHHSTCLQVGLHSKCLQIGHHSWVQLQVQLGLLMEEKLLCPSTIQLHILWPADACCFLCKGQSDVILHRNLKMLSADIGRHTTPALH